MMALGSYDCLLTCHFQAVRCSPMHRPISYSRREAPPTQAFKARINHTRWISPWVTW